MVYAYPCMITSLYASKNGVSCGTATEQVEDIINYLNNNGAPFDQSNAPSGTAPSGFTRLTLTAKPHNFTVSALVINLEDQTPNLYFDTDHERNVAFLAEFVNAAKVNNIVVYFYTTLRDWYKIFPDSYDGVIAYSLPSLAAGTYSTVNPFRSIPLIMPRYDGVASTTNTFGAFEGWTSMAMKQLSGGSTLQRRMGGSRVCVDYLDPTEPIAKSYIYI